MVRRRFGSRVVIYISDMGECSMGREASLRGPLIFSNKYVFIRFLCSYYVSLSGCLQLCLHRVFNYQKTQSRKLRNLHQVHPVVLVRALLVLPGSVRVSYLPSTNRWTSEVFECHIESIYCRGDYASPGATGKFS
jgi:hypothetical protein